MRHRVTVNEEGGGGDVQNKIKNKKTKKKYNSPERRGWWGWGGNTSQGGEESFSLRYQQRVRSMNVMNVQLVQSHNPACLPPREEKLSL